MNRFTSLTGKIWNFRGKKSSQETLFEAFFRIREYPTDVFTQATHSHFSGSEALSDMEKAVGRILEAKEKKEKILIFGDFDLDGASGSATLYFALKAIGIFPHIKLPSRTEGYGLLSQSYDEAKEKGASLLITVDCGSSSGEAIAYGNTLGIETIVTDHHTLPKSLPDAVAVVHPHRGSPEDDTWHLTGAGVAFFLGKALLETVFPAQDHTLLLSKLAEIAVLGTVADVGQLVGQNRVITQIGLAQMQKQEHPGLTELLKAARIAPDSITAESIAFFLAPRLNAAGRMAHPNTALRLLLGDKTAAQELEALNQQRRATTDHLCQLAETLLPKEELPHIALYHDEFFPGVAGLIASTLSEKYARPTIIFSDTNEPNMLSASCRGPEDFHFADALKNLSHHLDKHGGHAGAAGLSIHRDKVDIFVEAFAKLVADKRGKEPPFPVILADTSADLSDFFLPDFERVSCAAPFGAGNPAPLFCLQDISLRDIRVIGQDGTHLAGNITDNRGKVLPFVAFRFANIFPNTKWEQPVDLLVSVEKERWKGREKLKARIVDIRLQQ